MKTVLSSHSEAKKLENESLMKDAGSKRTFLFLAPLNASPEALVSSTHPFATPISSSLLDMLVYDLE